MFGYLVGQTVAYSCNVLHSEIDLLFPWKLTGGKWSVLTDIKSPIHSRIDTYTWYSP